MSITFAENQTIRKDFQLAFVVDYHLIHLDSGWNEIVYDGAPMDVSETGIANLVAIYHYTGSEWLVYLPTWPPEQCNLKTLEYGKTYQINTTTTQDWKVTNYVPPPVEGVYTCSVYYCYLQGCEGSTVPSEWHSDWYNWCKWLVEYQANLLTDYIKSQGLAADMPILSIEKVSVPPEYLDGSRLITWKLHNKIQEYPSFNNANIHVCIGENNYQMGSIYVGIGTTMIRGWTLEQQIRGMEGDVRYDFIGGCTLAHELGHGFHLDHCGNPPCPMHGIQLTYAEWVNMGKKLWFCNTCRPILLTNWESRNFV